MADDVLNSLGIEASDDDGSGSESGGEDSVDIDTLLGGGEAKSQPRPVAAAATSSAEPQAAAAAKAAASSSSSSSESSKPSTAQLQATHGKSSGGADVVSPSNGSDVSLGGLLAGVDSPVGSSVASPANAAVPVRQSSVLSPEQGNSSLGEVLGEFDSSPSTPARGARADAAAKSSSSPSSDGGGIAGLLGEAETPVVSSAGARADAAAKSSSSPSSDGAGIAGLLGEAETPVVSSAGAKPSAEQPQASIPAVLRVVSPNWQPECAGSFHIVAGESPNGRPLWCNHSSARWLYCNADGHWAIGGQLERDINFNCTNGYVLNMYPNDEGSLPHELGGSWTLWDGAQWQQDAAVAVTAEEQSIAPEVVGAATCAPDSADMESRAACGGGGAAALEAASVAAAAAASSLSDSEADEEDASAKAANHSEGSGRESRQLLKGAAEAAAVEAKEAAGRSAEARPSSAGSVASRVAIFERPSSAGSAATRVAVHQPSATARSPDVDLEARSVVASGEDDPSASNVLPSQVKYQQRLSVVKQKLADVAEARRGCQEQEQQALEEASRLKKAATAYACNAERCAADTAASRKAATAAAAAARRVESDELPAARTDVSGLQSLVADLTVGGCVAQLTDGPVPLYPTSMPQLSDEQVRLVALGVAICKRNAKATAGGTGDPVIDRLLQLDDANDRLAREEAQLQALCEAAHNHTQAKATDTVFRSMLQKLRSRVSFLRDSLLLLMEARERRPPGNTVSWADLINIDSGSPLRSRESPAASPPKYLQGPTETLEDMTAEVRALRSKSQRVACARHIQLRHEARQLQEQLLEALAARVRIEEAREAAEAERLEGLAEQRRRLAQRSLEMRQALCEELALKNAVSDGSRTARHSISGSSPRTTKQAGDTFTPTKRQRAPANCSSSATQLRGSPEVARSQKPWMPRRPG